jgi:hypothetical protein
MSNQPLQPQPRKTNWRRVAGIAVLLILLAPAPAPAQSTAAPVNECHISRDVQDLGKQATEVVNDILDRALMNAPESVHQKEVLQFVLKKMLEMAPPKDRQRISNELRSALNPHSPDNVLSFGVTCAIQI